MSDDGAFQLGIVMAGAVSGGAYTAGVVDFLIEALDAWQEAKDAGEDVPPHDVRVVVMTGTSAGAMNTALATVELNENFDSVHEVPAPPGVSARNKGYKSWVEEIDIVKLLGTCDLDNGENPLRSILTSKPRSMRSSCTTIISAVTKAWEISRRPMSASGADKPFQRRCNLGTIIMNS